MKKICLLLAAILMLLAACGTNTDQTEATAPASGGSEPSAPYALKVPPEDRNQAFAWETFVETPGAYYYGWDNVIFFCPR